MSPLPTDDATHFVSAAWSRLSLASTGRDSPWRTGVLATGGPHGPSARWVVLRTATVAPPSLGFYTDDRSPKLAAIEAEPRISWVAWDPDARVQLRASALARRVDSQPECEAIWAAMHPGQRAAYLGAAAPGSPQTEASPTQLDPDVGPRHLAIVRCEVTRVDVLWLASEHHIRAVADWDGNLGAWHSTWVAP